MLQIKGSRFSRPGIENPRFSVEVFSQTSVSGTESESKLRLGMTQNRFRNRNLDITRIRTGHWTVLKLASELASGSKKVNSPNTTSVRGDASGSA